MVSGATRRETITCSASVGAIFRRPGGKMPLIGAYGRHSAGLTRSPMVAMTRLSGVPARAFMQFASCEFPPQSWNLRLMRSGGRSRPSPSFALIPITFSMFHCRSSASFAINPSAPMRSIRSVLTNSSISSRAPWQERPGLSYVLAERMHFRTRSSSMFTIGGIAAGSMPECVSWPEF
jgi:hypothetical protein